MDQGNLPITDYTKNYITLGGLNIDDNIIIEAVNDYGTSSVSIPYNHEGYQELPFSQSFEYVQQNQYYNTFGEDNFDSSYDTDNPYDYTRYMLLGQSYNGPYGTCGIDFYVDLYNQKEVMLEFYVMDYGDETHDDDAVWLSTNGGSSFTKIYNLNPSNYPNNTWRQVSLNLSTIAENNNIPLTKNSIIRITQYDNYAPNTDGIGIDKLKVFSDHTPSTQETITLKCTKDAALVLNTNPSYTHTADNNYGTFNRVVAEEWTHGGYRTQKVALLDFNLGVIPPDARITNATLTLYSPDDQPNVFYEHNNSITRGSSAYKNNACNFSKVLEPWYEHTVTYNTRPRTMGYNRKYFPQSDYLSQDYINFDVTKLIQDINKNSQTHHGIQMELDLGEKYSSMVFASSDNPNSSIHPELTVEYESDSNEEIYMVPFQVNGTTSNESDDWDLVGSDTKDKAYKFYLPEGYTINAATCYSETDYDNKIEIFYEDGTSTGYYNDEGNCSSYKAEIPSADLPKGYYYIVVDGDGETGGYTLDVSGTSNSQIKKAEEQIDTESHAVKIYPNPNKGIFEIDAAEEISQIDIYSIDGQKVYSIKPHTKGHELNLSDVVPGIYNVVIKLEKSTFKSSVLIE